MACAAATDAPVCQQRSSWATARSSLLSRRRRRRRPYCHRRHCPRCPRDTLRFSMDRLEVKKRRVVANVISRFNVSSELSDLATMLFIDLD